MIRCVINPVITAHEFVDLLMRSMLGQHRSVHDKVSHHAQAWLLAPDALI